MKELRTEAVIQAIENGEYDERFSEIYMDATRSVRQKERYIRAVKEYVGQFGAGEVAIFSAPGRSEIGGNHTDHQHGEVLAASINLDAIAVTEKTAEPTVRLVSDGCEPIIIPLNDLQKRNEEEGTTEALIRGALAGVEKNGYRIGGFRAFVTSDVLIGAGLSSSAAFETLIGTIVSNLYNEGKITAMEIAQIGQYAENVYFGKPCGLMDQMACSVGSLVHIRFADPEHPQVERLELDLAAQGYSLCITDTRGSHADLTPDYAAIPTEMKQAAECLGREVLGQTTKEEVLAHLTEIRQKAGDRAALRALHYVCENERVQQETEALKQDRFAEFLRLVKESGDSSYKYLQNVFTCHDVTHQNVSVALAVSDIVLGRKGASRVHGGGFAGTIQAFVPTDMVTRYQVEMERVFGTGACTQLMIRKYGGIRVV